MHCRNKTLPYYNYPTHYKSTTLQFKKIIKERRKRNDYINTTHVSNIENLKIIANQNALQK